MSDEPNGRDTETLPELPTLGARLRWARHRAVLKQADLARLLGKGQQYIATLEHDRIMSPSPAVLAALATRLAVSPAWLMYGVATALTADEHTLLEDYRPLEERDRALVRFLVQELRRVGAVPEPQTVPLSEAALRLAQQWDRLSPDGQATVQAALLSLLPPAAR